MAATEDGLFIEARAGQVNRILVTGGDRGWVVVDTAGIVRGANCTRPNPADLTRVACVAPDPTSGRPVDEPLDATIELGDGADRLVFRATSVVNVDDGAGDDYISLGPRGDDWTNGLGNDRFYGGGGNDTASPSEGYPVRGGPGNDILYGGPGMDVLGGGGGADRMYGGPGTDDLFGGTGNDLVRGDSGNDLLYGNPGNDVIFGSLGIDRMYGGLGRDRIDGRIRDYARQ